MKNEFISDLYNKYNKEMYRYAQSILKSRSLAEDAVNQTFFSILGKSEQLRLWDDEKIKYYIFTSLRCTCLDMAKNLKMQETNEQPMAEIEDMVFQRVETYETHDITSLELKNAINKLPQNYRKIIYLRVVCGYSYKEIAESLGVSTSCVGVMLNRAKRKLKDII